MAKSNRDGAEIAKSGSGQQRWAGSLKTATRMCRLSCTTDNKGLCKHSWLCVSSPSCPNIKWTSSDWPGDRTCSSLAVLWEPPWTYCLVVIHKNGLEGTWKGTSDQNWGVPEYSAMRETHTHTLTHKRAHTHTHLFPLWAMLLSSVDELYSCHSSLQPWKDTEVSIFSHKD